MHIGWGQVLSYVGTYVAGILSAWLYHWIPAKIAYDAEQRKRRDEEIRRAAERIHKTLIDLANSVPSKSSTKMTMHGNCAKTNTECSQGSTPTARSQWVGTFAGRLARY